MAADLPLLHQIGERADAVLDRHALVPAVQIVQVDHIGLQALRRLSSQVCFRISGLPSSSRRARNMPHLLASTNSLAPVFERFAEQRFVGAEAVERGRIEKGVAEVERLQQHLRRGFRIGRRAIGVAQAHAAEADGGNFERTEFAGDQ